jgi:hypothetical protein
MKTDTELKQLLAKMLPEVIEHRQHGHESGHHTHMFYWTNGCQVLDTELLHLCWMVEGNLPQEKRYDYCSELIAVCCGDGHGYGPDGEIEGDDFDVFNATWQQRTIALAKVKGLI